MPDWMLEKVTREDLKAYAYYLLSFVVAYDVQLDIYYGISQNTMEEDWKYCNKRAKDFELW